MPQILPMLLPKVGEWFLLAATKELPGCVDLLLEFVEFHQLNRSTSAVIVSPCKEISTPSDLLNRLFVAIAHNKEITCTFVKQ